MTIIKPKHSANSGVVDHNITCARAPGKHGQRTRLSKAAFHNIRLVNIDKVHRDHYKTDRYSYVIDTRLRQLFEYFILSWRQNDRVIVNRLGHKQFLCVSETKSYHSSGSF